MKPFFHGKILLFGEYTVISGSRALVIPLRNYSGCLKLPVIKGSGDPDGYESNRELRRFFEYLSASRNPVKGMVRDHAGRSGRSGDPETGSESLDLDRMGRELDRGLYYDSSIPQGYGAGSSAALVAAVYHEFARKRIPRSARTGGELTLLRKIFSGMESKFHGTSSGIDPVCCYTGMPVLADGPAVSPVGYPELPAGSRFFLVDTGIRGDTGPLVTEYQRKLAEDPAFVSMLGNSMVPLVEDCIGSLLAGSHAGLTAVLRKLSACQLENFGPMITGPVGELWRRGLGEKSFTLKLCGSGGGGFYLGYAEDWNNAFSDLVKSGMRILPLEL